MYFTTAGNIIVHYKFVVRVSVGSKRPPVTFGIRTKFIICNSVFSKTGSWI